MAERRIGIFGVRGFGVYEWLTRPTNEDTSPSRCGSKEVLQQPDANLEDLRLLLAEKRREALELEHRIAAAEDVSQQPAGAGVAAPAASNDRHDWDLEFTHRLEKDVSNYLSFARLLDSQVSNSIRLALQGLNDGVLRCDEGFCIVFSASKQAHYLLYTRDKKEEVFKLFGLEDVSQQPVVAGVAALAASNDRPPPAQEQIKKDVQPKSPSKMPQELDEEWKEPRSGPENPDTQTWESLEGTKLEPLLDDIDLVDLEYIVKCIEADRPVPRWQDVPVGARINRDNVKRIQDCINPYALSILVLSYPWMDPEHPDKKLIILKRLLPALKAFLEGAKKKGEDYTAGLMMDYPCLPQKHVSGKDDRTPEQKQRFKRALGSINEWYKHPYATVLIFDVELPGRSSGHTNVRQYMQRGWCSFEFRTACLVKAMFCLWSLKGYETSKFSSWAAAVQPAKSAICRAAPMTPDKFGEMLIDGVKNGNIAFTAEADLELVVDQYRQAFTSAFTDTHKLMYQTLKWPDEQAFELAEALTYAKEQGMLENTQSLYIWDNKFTEAGTNALKKAIEGTKISMS